MLHTEFVRKEWATQNHTGMPIIMLWSSLSDSVKLLVHAAYAVSTLAGVAFDGVSRTKRFEQRIRWRVYDIVAIMYFAGFRSKQKRSEGSNKQ